MANIVITSNMNNILVDFGNYSLLTGFSKGMWPKGGVQSVTLGDTIIVHMKNEREWNLSFDGANNTLIIDSVEGSAPVSNLDLYNKLIDLVV